jgi:DivIVA domain-containing protein
MAPSQGDPDLDRLRGASFTHVRWREGYAIGEVDAFIERAVQALGSTDSELRAADVRAARFRPVRMREGYEMREVDTYLDNLEQQLAQRHPEPEPGASDGARPSLVEMLKSGSMASKLTWALLLLVVLVWVYAEVIKPHWAGG